MLLLRHFKLIWFPHWQICCKGPRVVSRLVAHIFSGFKRSGEAWKCSVVGLSVHLADTSQPLLICLQGTGSEQGGKFGENIGHISKRRIRYLDFSGQLICFKRQFLRSQKFWDMCSVFHLLLDAHSGCLDANCETRDKTLRCCGPCPVSREEQSVWSKEN